MPNETFDFCHHLNDNGSILYLLSDQPHFRTEFIKDNFDPSCFRKTFFSLETGSLKKQKGFLMFIEKTKINPKESIFIDYSRENILKAKQFNFNTILYKNLKNLKNKLKKFNI